MKKLILSFIFGIFLISSALAISTLSTPSSCCEKTLAGGICINDDQTQCDTSFKFAPTSCESTSFCKIGTCYDSKEGICTENVPQSVCLNKNGTWSEKKASQLSQCQLGCCIISDQASFVPLVRCKRLSTSFGVTMDFRSAIKSEVSCIAVANEQDTGACVYSVAGDRTCKFTTRKDCGVKESVISLNSSDINDTTSKRFYKDVLCSAEELSTTCARQMTTGCYKGDVFWFDSCGNRENVYSSNKDASWNKGRVATPEEVCSPTSGSRDCGNCDYLLGSVCSQWTGFLGLGKPTFGNFFCKKTTCKDRDGNERMNGESWCVYDSPVANGRDPAGSRQYREICINGEVQVEPCADYRNEICIHSGIPTSQGEFSTSACRVNRWQDCTAQTNKRTCENVDQRDCLWVEKIQGIDFNGNKSLSTSSQPFSNPVSSAGSSSSASSQLVQGATAASSLTSTVGSFSNAGATGKVVSTITGEVISHNVGAGVGEWEQAPTTDTLRTNRTDNESGLCVPKVSPGQQFWTSGDAQTICAQASATCQVKITTKTTKDILTGKEKKSYTMEDNECLSAIKGQTNKYEVKSDWAIKANAICSALGDCGADININGRFTDEGYVWRYDNKSYFFTQEDVAPLKSAELGTGTGTVVAIDYVINNNLKLNSEDYVYVKA